MEKEGKYIYCIIGTKQDRNFGPIAIGESGDEVLTIGYDDLYGCKHPPYEQISCKPGKYDEPSKGN